MQADLDRKLSFPPEIITTHLRPDLILWPTSQKHLYIIELTVLWEVAVEEAELLTYRMRRHNRDGEHKCSQYRSAAEAS